MAENGDENDDGHDNDNDDDDEESNGMALWRFWLSFEYIMMALQ